MLKGAGVLGSLMFRAAGVLDVFYRLSAHIMKCLLDGFDRYRSNIDDIRSFIEQIFIIFRWPFSKKSRFDISRILRFMKKNSMEILSL